jgi:hypothetical protein
MTEIRGYMIMRDLPNGKRMVATDGDNKIMRFETIEEAAEGMAAWVEAEWYIAHVTVVDE